MSPRLEEWGESRDEGPSVRYEVSLEREVPEYSDGSCVNGLEAVDADISDPSMSAKS